MSHAAISLGGNLGSVAENFRMAIDRLSSAGIEIQQKSAIFRTAAVGESTGDYHNAAAILQTSLSPDHLLQTLNETESTLGRVRNGNWSARTLDLDILWYDDVVCETPRLTLPHPACWYRRFVLDPLAEVCPAWVHPHKQLSVSTLLERFSRRPLSIGLAGGSQCLRKRLVSASLRPSREVLIVDVEGISPSMLPAIRQDFAVVAWFGEAQSDSTEIGEERQSQSSRRRSPSSEELLRWPAENRLDASRLPCRVDDWMRFLLQAVLDVPVRLGRL